jgi:tRNA U34 5-carboxymethylaminomethyl modifying GTPase MnmE/TrmE
LVIYVAETTAPWDDSLYTQVVRLSHVRSRSERTTLERTTVQRPLIVAHNKCDLARPPADGRPAGVEISAKTASGIDALCAAIGHALVPAPPPRGAAVPFTTTHIRVLKDAAAHLARGDCPAAHERIAFLLDRPYRSS